MGTLGAGTTAAGSPAKNASRRRVSRWQIGADAGRGAIALRGRLEVGHAPLHGYESFGGSERSGMNTPATTFGSPRGSRVSPPDHTSTNVRKTLDTTAAPIRSVRFACSST